MGEHCDRDSLNKYLIITTYYYYITTIKSGVLNSVIKQYLTVTRRTELLWECTKCQRQMLTGAREGRKKKKKKKKDFWCNHAHTPLTLRHTCTFNFQLGTSEMSLKVNTEGARWNMSGQRRTFWRVVATEVVRKSQEVGASWRINRPNINSHISYSTDFMIKETAGLVSALPVAHLWTVLASARWNIIQTSCFGLRYPRARFFICFGRSKCETPLTSPEDRSR